MVNVPRLRREGFYKPLGWRIRMTKLPKSSIIENYWTVVEHHNFSTEAEKIWHEEALSGFIDFIARNPKAGDVIKSSHGARKVRWKANNNKGKSGGARIIYYCIDDPGIVYLIDIYLKSKQENQKLNLISNNY